MAWSLPGRTCASGLSKSALAGDSPNDNPNQGTIAAGAAVLATAGEAGAPDHSIARNGLPNGEGRQQAGTAGTATPPDREDREAPEEPDGGGGRGG